MNNMQCLSLSFFLKGDKEHKESLLFSALTKFMTKSALSSISEIERSHNPIPPCVYTILLSHTLNMSRYYNAKVRKSPHVVGHYAAGARLIGLTEKQMALHLATLNQSGDENSDSPYAQPVCLFSSPAKAMNHPRNGRIKLRIVNQKFRVPENAEYDKQSSTDTSQVRTLFTIDHILLLFKFSLLRLIPLFSRPTFSRHVVIQSPAGTRHQPPTCPPCTCAHKSLSSFPPSL